jgi:hypothetical protein
MSPLTNPTALSKQAGSRSYECRPQRFNPGAALICAGSFATTSEPAQTRLRRTVGNRDETGAEHDQVGLEPNAVPDFTI